MNDYRTEILLDLRRAVRGTMKQDYHQQIRLHRNIGYWLARVHDATERNRWEELFAIELALALPGLHEDYCWDAVRQWIAEAQQVESQEARHDHA